MVAGHISEKKGYLYAVIQLKDAQGKRKSKWIATHLKVRGNKKRAEEILMEFRREYTARQTMSDRSQMVLFDIYLEDWLESRRGKIAPNTFSGYQSCVENSICPYFREKNTLLNQLKPKDIQAYYDTLYAKGLSGNTVLHHHVLIRKALEDAVLKELIPINPTDRMERPKKEQYLINCYSVPECNRLLDVTKEEKLRLVITLALFYGLRRSEVLGLRWGAVDFEQKTVSVTHSVSFTCLDEHYILIRQDKMKRKSSFRTLPLIDSISKLLLYEIAIRYGGKKPPEGDYICVDEAGVLFRPQYVTEEFTKLLKRNGLRPIRFHDLRHSCANILIADRVPLIEVQQWLGHSNISTTADLYSHLTYETKLQSARNIKKN